jgi:L-Ala-D/L-Glu epimerase
MQILSSRGILQFIYPFTISGGRTKTHQETLLIKLEHLGLTGIGEAPAITYYNVHVDDMLQKIASKRDYLQANFSENPQEFYPILLSAFPHDSFIRCAIDIALWDLWGKLNNKPAYEMMGFVWKNSILTDYTIGIDRIDMMVEKMKNKLSPMYKVKVGNENDIEIISALRANTDKPFRVDANAGWTLDEATRKIPELKKLGVILVEQPLAKDAFDEMIELKKTSVIPLFADESCVLPEDVKKCTDGFHGINIKLTKCGGITPALGMIAEAKSHHLEVMMGNMNDSSIGTAAIAQFLPVLDHIDADGPLLLQGDHAQGITIKNGILYLSHKSGLGIEALF